MDKLIHTALNSIANLRDSQIISAQNLANQNVPGFRRDLANEGDPRFLAAFDAASSRVFQTERGLHQFSQMAGTLEDTGEPMDIAIADEGYFYVQPPVGDPALSRRGDLRVTVDGTLMNGAGQTMLDGALQPIVLPPLRSMVIDDLGQVMIEPLDGPPGQMVRAATLASVVPNGVDLQKSPDGLIRAVDAPLPPPDQRARIVQGMLESSNVNAIEELVQSIDLQRTFELNMKMISTAKDLDESGTRLLRMPDA